MRCCRCRFVAWACSCEGDRRSGPRTPERKVQAISVQARKDSSNAAELTFSDFPPLESGRFSQMMTNIVRTMMKPARGRFVHSKKRLLCLVFPCPQQRMITSAQRPHSRDSGKQDCSVSLQHQSLSHSVRLTDCPGH